MNKRRRSYRSYLLGLRVNPGPFVDIIDKAAQQEWSSAEFLYSVSKSGDFRRMFPGVGALFKEGASVTTAIGEWRQRAAEYRDIQQNLDVPYNLNRRRVGYLIKHNVSGDEFAQRLLVEDAMAATEGVHQAFNALLSQRQQKQLDKKGWFKFLMGESERTLYDLYEAATISTAGLEISKEEALGLARGIGPAGELVGDLGKLVTQVKELKATAGQEIKDAGITDADLVQTLSGNDPRGLKPVLERIVNARQALAEPRGGAADRGDGRAPVLFGAGSEGL
jgi:hypothetical protein